jgi:rubrerythrin
MPEFLNPFTGMTPARKLTTSELVRAIRENVAAELEATHLYQAHADATDNEVAKKVLLDIADEERVHIGEFMRLIEILAPDEAKWLAQGAAEVNAMAAGVAKPQPGADAGENAPTIGSMRQ